MTPVQEALTEAINSAGGQSELARRLSDISGRKVKQQQVWNWLHREKRPPVKQSQFIERITGVTKERLRPDIFHESTNSAA